MNEMSKLPISVAIVAHNEEENLKRCLQSVRNWVQEIVVVINDCEDGTEEVARSFDANVSEEPFENYSLQVAKALDKTTQPWTLVLDADEEVTPALQDAIRRFVEKDDPSVNGASFKRRARLFGRWITHGDWYPDRVNRLFRKEKGESRGAEHGYIHIEGKIKDLDADLNHFSFPSVDVEMKKIAHFAKGFEKRNANKHFSLIECLFRSSWRVIRSYIIRLGFLDGFPGLYVALYVGYTAFVRYSRLYAHDQEKKHSQ